MNRGFAGLIAGLLVLLLAAALFALFGVDYRKNWNAREMELEMTLPGDTLVTSPDVVTTRAISIQASPRDVWPWLVQMGQRRGGFYTHTALQNLAGLKMKNAWEIVPEWQEVEVGNHVYLAPGETVVLSVREVIPDSALVLQLWNLEQDRPDTVFAWSWAFVLRSEGENASRLLIRTRVSSVGTTGGFTGTMMDFTSWMMESGTLRGVKIRAERTAR